MGREDAGIGPRANARVDAAIGGVAVARERRAMVMPGVPLDAAPATARAAALLDRAAEWLSLGLETIACAVIAIGAAAAFVRLVAHIRRADAGGFFADRLVLARYLAWALEFQLADDILETAITPDWKKIGELAAIAAIRTVLNYFLGREMDDERERVTRSAAEARKSNTSTSVAT